MATHATNARRDEWERAFSKLTELNHKLIAAPEKDREAIEQQIAAQEEDVLDTPAPSFSAVISKLYLLWYADIEGLDPEAEAKRLILEDLELLLREGARVLVHDVTNIPPGPDWQPI
jgi:hypothetical protein